MNKYSQKQKNEIDDSLLIFDQIPEAVVNAQKDISIYGKEEQEHSSKVNLFFSFDIVNSTMYKMMTANWPLVIRGLLEDIRARIIKIQDLSSCFLWRVIGDEMVYVLPLESEEQLKLAVDAIFEVTQRISISLKSGKFFDLLTNQSLQKGEINILKTQNKLSVKATAWIAAINEKLISPYDNISFYYEASANSQILREYLGRDVDTGFRLKEYTQDRRLVINMELACMLLKWGKSNNMHVMDYVRLKGVWNEALYPVIWYYDAAIVSSCYKNVTGEDVNITFANSFRYDETDKNVIVNKYFKRGKSKNKNQEKQFEEIEFSSNMYKIEKALPKILVDRNLKPKIEYIEELLSGDVEIQNSNSFVNPLELHCAVVCCDTSDKKILISQRCAERDNNPGKWEFGCAKVKSDKTMVECIVDYYKTAFGVTIELVLDKLRNEKQPLPIAVYEITKQPNIKKGIIFIAKVISDIKPEEFRPESAHTCIKWVSQDEANEIKEEEAITDFRNTFNKVFNNFDDYFS